MAERKVPRIRFKGFEEDWEQRKAKELCIIETGKSNTQDQVEDGRYPFYIRSDVPARSNKYLYDCEAVITIGDGNIGRVFHYVNGKFDLHQRCYKMSEFHGIFGKYFFYFFSSRFYDRAMKMTAKATVDSVRLEMISEMDIVKPLDLREQWKISVLITNLDSILSLHQRKLEKLKILKKAMLEKMFPKNGAKVPEIRFSGFPDDWEQRKLGEIASEIVAGGDVNKKSIQEVGKYPVIANALTDGGIIGYYNEEYRISAPALTVTGRGDIGHAKVRLVNFTPVVRLLAIKAKHDMFFLENNINIKKAITESTGVPQLTIPQLAKYELFIPKKRSEEESVGMLFKYIDSLLSLHQRKLEKLRQIKKSMLERMFV